jgi:hypothetical protein
MTNRRLDRFPDRPLLAVQALGRDRFVLFEFLELFVAIHSVPESLRLGEV